MTKSSAMLRQEIAALEAQYHEAAKTEFGEKSKALFEAHPRLKSFGWTQYTPYFNDGEECVFKARTDDPDINGYDEYSEESGDEQGENLYNLASRRAWDGHSFKDRADWDRDAEATVKAVKAFLGSFDEEYYREAFGDHMKVVVTRNGVEANFYEHD